MQGGTTHEWFLQIAGAAEKLLAQLGAQRGVGGYSYSVRGQHEIEIDALIQPAGSELAAHPEHGKARFLKQMSTHPERAAIMSAFTSYRPTVVVLSRLPSELASSLGAQLPAGGVDSVGMMGGAWRGRGIHLCSLSARKLAINDRSLSYLTSLTEHLSASYRVRCLLAEDDTCFSQPAAVADAEGRLLHATGRFTQRRVGDAFIANVRRLERARCQRFRHSERSAAELWSAFLEGEYALVDAHDTDGKRMILAIRTGATHRKRLTSRQYAVAECAARGDCNKVIGAKLGISTSAVAAHLAAAMAKLGIANRGSLIQWLSSARRMVDETTEE